MKTTTKFIELHGRRVQVPEQAKFVWQDREGMCWWGVRAPIDQGEYWKFPEGEFGAIKFPKLLKGV